MKRKGNITPIIKLVDVCKTYFLGKEKVYAVSHINLEIKAKEFIGIVGSSGSGKSTLMYLIGLLETPTSGQVILGGKDISSLSDDELSKIRNEYVGFVFQSFNLINKMTILENVILPTRYVKGQLKFNPQTKAEELLQKFGIYDRRHFFPNKISGGQQQRAAIARAPIMSPKIILADEPTGNLDTKTGHEILNLLDTLNDDFDTTIIVVTHEREVAERTQRQIYLQDGSIIKRKL